MSRLASIALAAAAAIAVSGCGTSACQELGVKLCECQAGMTKDTCTAQVQEQLNNLGADTPGFSSILENLAAGKSGTFEAQCKGWLGACEAPPDATFCEWVLTPTGKEACGLAPASAP